MKRFTLFISIIFFCACCQQREEHNISIILNVDEFRKILWMPEALIIQRYKYDEEKRREYYGDKPTPYDAIDVVTGRTTPDWWEKFNALNKKQREQIEQLIAEHDFSDDVVDVADKEIKEVLKYYQIKRDK
jgi:hypothetical protein